MKRYKSETIERRRAWLVYSINVTLVDGSLHITISIAVERNCFFFFFFNKNFFQTVCSLLLDESRCGCIFFSLLISITITRDQNINYLFPNQINFSAVWK